MISWHHKYFSLILILLSVFVIAGCNNGPTDALKPSVILYSPVSNDTLVTGIYEIICEMSDDQGIKYVAVYLNDQLQDTFNTPEYQARPAVYLTLDSSHINKRISYYIVAYDLNNNASKSEIKSNILVLKNMDHPNSPYNLDVRLITSTLLNIFWEDTNEYEKGFEVWRREGYIGTYNLWRVFGPNTFNTNDATINPSQIYFYKVRAFNEFGYSDFSYEVTSIGSGGSASLPAPTNVTAEIRGTNCIYLYWQDNSWNETIFQIERKSGSQAFGPVGRVGPNITTFKDSANGLSAGTEYKYRIKVYSETDSSWSQEITARTYAVAINAPSNLAAVQYDSITVRLTWSDNSIYENYTFIERKIGDNGTFIQVGQVSTDITVFDDRTYTPNVKNIYRIKSTDGNGSYSNYSAEVTIVPTRQGIHSNSDVHSSKTVLP